MSVRSSWMISFGFDCQLHFRNQPGATLFSNFVTPAQLCVRYAMQLGTAALPKTKDPEHMKENAAVDFTISAEDMNALMKLSFEDPYGKFSVFPVFSGK